MNEVLENIIPWMEVLEAAIYNDDNCPTSFEKRFCQGNQLLGVWFSSENIKVLFMLSSGEQVVNSFKINELNDWLEGDDA
jgi:hypothetical protein